MEAWCFAGGVFVLQKNVRLRQKTDRVYICMLIGRYRLFTGVSSCFFQSIFHSIQQHGSRVLVFVWIGNIVNWLCLADLLTDTVHGDCISGYMVVTVSFRFTKDTELIWFSSTTTCTSRLCPSNWMDDVYTPALYLAVHCLFLHAGTDWTCRPAERSVQCRG